MLRRFLAGARTRIVAAFVVLLAFSAVLSVLAIRELLLVRSADRGDDALEQEIAEFRALSRGRDPRTGKPFGTDLEAIFDHYFDRNVPGEHETVLALLGRERFRTESGSSIGPVDLGARVARWSLLHEPERGELSRDGDTIRYLAVPVEVGRQVRGAFVVAVVIGGAEVEEPVRFAALVLTLVLFIATALCWLVAGRVLAPLRLLSDTARSITETDLTRRISVAGSDEIAQLARTFNAMLDRLERAFATQRAFVSDASHELRTPITIVRGHLELLGEDPAERRDTVKLVMDELDRMSRFVDDLLLLARAERDDFLRPGEVELGALTDELLDKALALGHRGWRLERRGEAVVAADRQRLTQALMGLAQNAVQHTGEGDPIWIGSAVRGAEARLWVRDHGPGVPYADQERVFERFARASNSRRRSPGAGLGLAIVRAIAEAHGGRVELSSRPGVGATFTLVIPVAPEEDVIES